MRLFIKIISLLFSLFIPGGSLLIAGQRLFAFAIPITGFAWVLFISLNRWVISINGFLALLIGLLSLHFISYLVGVVITIKDPKERFSTHSILLLILLCFINITTTISCHFYKDKWFGFAFYHIPSSSMHPTLKIGDVVLVDSWHFKNHQVKVGDVVIVKRQYNSVPLAKRVSRVRLDAKQSLEIFVEGDNKNRSVDSRRFGWLSGDLLIAKVRFIWFSFREKERLFNIIK